MEYGVFQIQENLLVLKATLKKKDEAIDFVKTGTDMVILEIYL